MISFGAAACDATNWSTSKAFMSTASEGLNSKIQAIKANTRGFRNFENYRVSILFFCGKLEHSP